jgi:hypothetical protein
VRREGEREGRGEGGGEGPALTLLAWSDCLLVSISLLLSHP